jgi:hypothetical protein
VKVLRLVGRLSLVVAVFAIGFIGRQIIGDQLVQASDSQPDQPTVAIPVMSTGVIGSGTYPYYAAVSNVDSLAVHNAPDPSSPVRNTFGRTNAEGAPSTFLITGQQTAVGGSTWYQILLPVRPNGTKGWVLASDVTVTGEPWQIHVHRKSFKLDVLKDGQRQATYFIGQGATRTPTPDGLYSVVEILKPPNPNTIYGTHVLGLNGYSNVETDWPDGGHIAIHGTNSPKTTIPHRVSHGCVRVTDANIDTLAAEIPLGTPVRITND